MKVEQMLQNAAKLEQEARTRLDALGANTDLDAEAVEAEQVEIKGLIDKAKGYRARAETQAAIESDLQGLGAPVTATEPGANCDGPARAGVGSVADASRPTFAEPRDLEAAATGGFESLGAFAGAVIRAGISGGSIDQRLQVGAAASGMSLGSGPDGAYALPPRYVTEIWDGTRKEVDSLLPMTDEYPIDGSQLVLAAAQNSDRRTGSRYGGAQAYRVSEAGEFTASSPKLRRLELNLQKVGVLVYITEELMGSGAGMALERFVRNAAIDEINWFVGNDIVNGTGANQPRGILNSPALVVVPKEAGQASDSLTEQNIADMWARMPARNRRNARWLVNQDVDPQLLTMTRVVKNVAGDENVGGVGGRLYDAERDTILGRPVVRTEFNRSLGDQGDVILADLGAYATAYRSRGIEAAVSMHVRFVQHEQAFRFSFSYDGEPWQNLPITPANGTKEMSAFVTLADRT